MTQGIHGKKYFWQMCAARSERTFRVARQLNVSASVVQTLETRGLTDEDAIRAYLNPVRDEVVGDAALLAGAVRAVERIERAVRDGEKILIAGDYDVDGVTSSALLLACLVPLGARINFFLPHRQKDGYGLSVHTIERAAASGYRVVITVDNGITAVEPARVARELGIDLIITDHHRPQAILPDAYAIVDPHQEDCAYPFKYFAGVGVGFKLMSLLYERLQRPLPDTVYELLTLGTIADVVPLVGENRYWVREGLRKMNERVSLPLSLLKQNARLDRPLLKSLDIGFYLAPQINALGRLDDARAAVGFLLGNDAEQAARVAAILAEMNGMRKEVEKGVVQEIVARVESGAIDLKTHGVIVAVGKGWSPGVVGLAAARLVGLYGRPAIVLHQGDDGMVKGSCRSIPEIDMFDALTSIKELLCTFGGHPMAAGVSLRHAHVGEFIQKLDEYVRERVPIDELRQKVYVDAEVSLPELTHQLARDIAYLEPFGAGNREPLFYFDAVSLVQDPTLLKDVHVKCMIFSEGVIKPIIFFNRPELYAPLRDRGNAPFKLVASVNENHWNNRVSIELTGVDVVL